MSGSGGGGGYEYQAKVTAYVAAHILAGQRLNWIEHEQADVPVAVAEETGGAGDDLLITLQDSAVIELQAKHGLRKDDKFWQAILKLGKGLQDNPALYGVLLIDSTASKVLREDVRQDLKRLGQGRTDGLKSATKELQGKFEVAGFPTESTELFRRLRIIVLDLDDDLPDGKQAHLVLTQILNDLAQASSAWSELCREGQSLLSTRGRRDSVAWARLLSSKGIHMNLDFAQTHGTRTPEERQYLKKIVHKYQAWWEKSFQFLYEIRGFQPPRWHPFPLSVKPQEIKPGQNSSEAETEKALPRPVLDLIQFCDNRPSLIFGKPGAGKSTFLQQALFELANKANQPENTDAPIPVLIQVKPHSRHNIIELIQEAFKNQRFLLGKRDEEIKIYIENLIANNRLFALIDIASELPREIADSLKEFCDQDIPIIVAMRDVGMGSLGIQEKFEIQSLKKKEVKNFFQTYLPLTNQADIHSLCERVRDFGKTPLMVWMLYIIAQTRSTPKTRGEVYQIFTAIYEEEVKSGMASDELRNILAQVGYMMTNTNQPVLQSQIRSKFGEQALKALLENHLLYWTGNPGIREVNFCHPSLQEYYAAQYLYQSLLSDEIHCAEWLNQTSDDTYSIFQQDYLNYTKWTEPIALMLGLPEITPSQAEKIVKQALDVDLMLGARLAGEVRSGFQEKTVQLINDIQTATWFKVKLLEQTRSEVASLELLKNIEFSDSLAEEIEYADLNIRTSTAKALGKIGAKSEILGKLCKLLTHSNFIVRCYAATALGEIGSEDAVSCLLGLLDDPEEDVRSGIAEALGKIGSEGAVFGLIKLAKNSEYYVCKNSIEALGKIGSNIAVSELLEIFNYSQSDVRCHIINALSEANDEVAIPILIKAVEDQNLRVRSHAVKALGKLASGKDIPILLAGLKNSRPEVRTSTAEALGWIGSQSTVFELIKALQDSVPEVRSSSAEALGKIGCNAAASRLIDILEDSNWNVRRKAVEALGKIKSEVSIPKLLSMLEDEEFFVRTSAAEALSGFSSSLVIQGLQKLLQHHSSDVRGVAAKALGYLGGDAKIVIPDLLKLICDEDWAVRTNTVEALGSIAAEDSEDVITALTEAIKDPSIHDRTVISLGKIGYKLVIPELFQALKMPSRQWSASIALGEYKNDCAAHILSSLYTLLPTPSGEYAFDAIQSIQSNCKFYNYEIFRSPPAKPQSSQQETLATIATTVVETNERIKQMADQPSRTINMHGSGNYIEKVEDGYHEHRYAQEASTEADFLTIVQIIQALEQKHDQVNNQQQAIEIIDAEFKVFQASQSPQWQNLLSVKRLYNGGKKAAVKVGEHFTQENPWGKGFVAFLEGFSEDVK